MNRIAHARVAVSRTAIAVAITLGSVSLASSANAAPCDDGQDIFVSTNGLVDTTAAACDFLATPGPRDGVEDSLFFFPPGTVQFHSSFYPASTVAATATATYSGLYAGTVTVAKTTSRPFAPTEFSMEINGYRDETNHPIDPTSPKTLNIKWVGSITSTTHRYSAASLKP